MRPFPAEVVATKPLTVGPRGAEAHLRLLRQGRVWAHRRGGVHPIAEPGLETARAHEQDRGPPATLGIPKDCAFKRGGGSDNLWRGIFGGFVFVFWGDFVHPSSAASLELPRHVMARSGRFGMISIRMAAGRSPSRSFRVGILQRFWGFRLPDVVTPNHQLEGH